MTHRGRPTAWSITMLAVVLLLAGCMPVGSTQPDPPLATLGPSPGSPAAPAPPPADVQLRAIVDTSGSVPRRFLRSSLRALAAAIRDWPRALPDAGGSTAQAGLDVEVRAISGTSYGPGALASGTVPAVPAVPEPPTQVVEHLTQRVIAYEDGRRAAVAAHGEAEAAARRLAATIERLRPGVAGCSDIRGAVSAAGESFNGPGPRKIWLMSDLAQHCKANVSGSLRGVDVLVVHLCWDADVCGRQRRAWRGGLAAHDPASLSFVRYELLDEKTHSFLHEE